MKTVKSAFSRLVGYLSRRDHSVRELTQKLSKFYDFDEIETAIRKANELKLLVDPRTHSQKLSLYLLGRGKGQRYISGYLKRKGLPVVEVSDEEEFAKAQELVANQLGFETPYTLEQKQKVFRYLNNRGFNSQVVKQVINEK